MDSLSQRQKVIIGVLAVVVICALIAGVAIVWFTMQQQQAPPAVAPSLTSAPTNTATATNTTVPTPTVVPAPIDPVWERIEAAGKIVVGMSADYPPFAYIDENFAIQGYDLALITEIGQRLAYPLEIKNMAFDGLFPALQLNEIDVAVAAISFTPERDKYVDFSNVYFVGEDALLARQDSTIEITRVEDLASYRVGVQRGSVYETWLTDVLIDPGLMRPKYLVLFDTPEQAVDELVKASPRIDLVMLDALPAEVAERAMAVKIVTRKLNPQLYALAIPSGATILQSKLNGALTQMQNDGTLGELALRYLNIDKLLPLPTPAPTQPPETPETCLDSLALVADLNHQDYNMTQPPQFGPGFTFQKGWRIRNTGTCTWDSNYILAYVGSNPPNSPVGGNPVAIQGIVEPGQTYDIYATLTTPYRAGVYQSLWTLRNPNGLFFGERIWAGFEVVVQETATPQPEAPQIYNFVVSPSQISEGDCVNISWSYGGQDITMSRLFRNSEVILFDMPVNGSFTDCPLGTGQMEYRLIVDSATAGSAVGTRFVEVVPVTQPTDTPAPTEAPPVIESFTVNPEQIGLGETVDLSWTYSGANVMNARLFRGDEMIAENLGPSDTLTDQPPVAGQFEYRLVVDSESAGSTEESRFVNVLETYPAPSSALEVAWLFFLNTQ